MKKWKIAGINFDHMHMGDLLNLAANHQSAEIVAICDEDSAKMADACSRFGLHDSIVFTDYRKCLETVRPDLVLLCPATAQHAEWVERIAPYGPHILVEKPFAGSLPEADRMIAAMSASGRELIVNWPLRWYPCHVTAKRLLAEGAIGEVTGIQYYDGNRGPTRHKQEKILVSDAEAIEQKKTNWFYKKHLGGGSLQDYLGYGVTLGTWFLSNRKPAEICCTTFVPPGLEVDEHCITVASYDFGLGKFETRWGTFTDPWTIQPQPKCGFVFTGTEGTLASYDYESTVRLQTLENPEAVDLPVDVLPPEERDVLSYTLHRLESGLPIEGPLSPSVCRIGQQIVDTAVLSAATKKTQPLLN